MERPVPTARAGNSAPVARLEHAVKCQWCNNPTRNMDGWCRRCAGPDRNRRQQNSAATGQASSLATKSILPTDDPKIKTPRPEQAEDCQLILDELRDNDRAQIRAACGMGKTVTGQLVVNEMSEELLAERGDAGLFLVTCPTIELARQLRGDYLSDGMVDAEVLSIHDDSEDFRGVLPEQREAAQARALDDFLNSEDDDKPRIVFAVASPRSLGKIAEAQERNDVTIDGAVFDEAHNLGGEVGVIKANGEVADRPRVFFDDEEGGLVIDKRVFMTATPRMSVVQQPFSGVGTRNAASANSDSASSYRRIMAGSREDSLFLDQGDERFFGRMVSSRSYAEAVGKGYLNPIDVEEVTTTVRNPMNLPVHRGGVIDITAGEYRGDRERDMRVTSKRKVRALDDNHMTVGAYQSACSIIQSLADDDGGSANVLSFSDNIDESRQIANKTRFRKVAMKLASDEIGGGEPPSIAQARKLVAEEGPESDQRLVRSARMVLLGRHAILASTSSKDSADHQRAAMNFLDKEQPGESVAADSWIGGWNPAPKILCNVDQLSEGVNQPSVDRVVLNRPSKSNDAANYQAAGRASRLWNDADGTSKKGRGRVLVSRTVEIDASDSRREILAKERANTERSLADIYYDTGAEDWRNPASAADVPADKRLNVVNRRTGKARDIRTHADASMRALRREVPLESAEAILRVHDVAVSKARAATREQRKKDRTAPGWEHMDSSERDMRTMVALQQIAMGTTKVTSQETDMFIARAIGQNGMTTEDVSALRMSLDNAYRKAAQGRELDEEESVYLSRRRGSSKRVRMHDKVGRSNEILRGLVSSGMLSVDDFR